ncbi:MAG TPA: DUF6448 family protein [Candidatus Nanopelagicales bacterium]
MTLITTMTATVRALARLIVQPADAHCDTEDGPAVTDGRRALASGNINHALKWVSAGSEDEVRGAFAAARAARATGGEVSERAERAFLETLVRVHRAGEGEGFDGIQPTGTALPPQVVAADRALAEGTIDPLRGLIPDDRWPELQRRFDAALAKKGFDVDDLAAAREYVEAYVRFFKYAEGEEHAHTGAHHHHG